ncbi:hypothetical protein QEZ54_32740 [Catellatospora sp. KI3]|uniref:hypothetical protein n=1 Tax=Catellatospora sp. KI3 TaxID=3041620 RepID=UPI002482C18C|nr:hypothetical protein [Catellatospora sp. KI3]MDI1465751.1 hypothetical protein [Catellatospora sp. KI3]
MPLQNDESARPEDLFAVLRHAVLEGPGSTPARVRQAVAAAKLDEVSRELRDYVATLREHAWRSTDEQVRELLAAGWSEDQVYELTVAVSVGAGQRRVDAGLAALARAEARLATASPPRVPPQARPAVTGAVRSAVA